MPNSLFTMGTLHDTYVCAVPLLHLLYVILLCHTRIAEEARNNDGEIEPQEEITWSKVSVMLHAHGYCCQL